MTTKATPIPDSIEKGRTGLDKAQCANEGGRIFRAYYEDQPLQWIHEGTGLSTCGGGVKK